ncbi:hypothetical protein [Nonomuraea sp. SBT364]|uniref:hypothetical protein n=1 Tax=Nonomuraea sp. SBT364 TaxID=1580530 RepID=UPI00066D394E|nr:hypothetical protein [Nonomuraea sp. SBT364]
MKNMTEQVSPLRHWPTMAAIAVAGVIAYGLTGGEEIAPILTASALIYLGAAALRRPTAAWPLFLISGVVIGATRALVPAVDPTWPMLGLAAVLAVYGLLTGSGGLSRPLLAMAGFGLVAVVTLAIGGDAGAYLVAAGMLGHAAWDVHHHRTGKVVVRSLAEFCFVLDTLIAVALVVLTVWP